MRGARATDDPAVAERVLRLADTEGIETIAEVWSGSPADSLAGCLWRLFVLRSWVYADPVEAARAYDAGRRTAEVAQVLAGVADPPGPEQLRTMVDEVLRGIAGSDFADVLFRAAAFARVSSTAPVDRSTATTRAPGTSVATDSAIAPVPQHRSTTTGRAPAPTRRAASSTATCATTSVSGRGTNTPGSTRSVRYRNAVCPTMCCSGFG